jgi:toxin ParE1/3/4
MPAVQVQEAASYRLDEIYRYTRDRCGDDQAERYITGLFDIFAKIATRDVISKPIPAQFSVDGYFCRYERHVVYWRMLSDGTVGIVTVLHERMHQIDRFREDFEF